MSANFGEARDEPLPPTYPARPMNGGRLEQAEPIDPEEWRFRPKYNGRRVLLHVPTMRTWNRELEENNWGCRKDFPAFGTLQNIIYQGDLWPPVLEWMDLELLYGKTSVGKRSIVVLDYVSSEPWWDRMVNLNLVFGEQDLDILGQPKEDEVYFARPMSKLPSDALKAWLEMQEMNKEWSSTFYEGLVAYNMRAAYPVQLFSPKRETRHWIKMRFVT